MHLIHYKRPRFFQDDGIAIAYRSEDVQLLDTEFVDLNDLSKVFDNKLFSQNNQAMFCLFEHVRSRKRIIAGNLHLHFNPDKDYIKFAQASYVMEKGALFAQKHTLDDKQTLPIIICGDFNSSPVSSVMSIFHDEDIEGYSNRRAEREISCWRMPEAPQGPSNFESASTSSGLNLQSSQGIRRLYQIANQMYIQKKHAGSMEPLAGNLESVYSLYNVGREEGDGNATSRTTETNFDLQS